MPTETVYVVAFVLAAFGVFAVSLAYADATWRRPRKNGKSMRSLHT